MRTVITTTGAIALITLVAASTAAAQESTAPAVGADAWQAVGPAPGSEGTAASETLGEARPDSELIGEDVADTDEDPAREALLADGWTEVVDRASAVSRSLSSTGDTARAIGDALLLGTEPVPAGEPQVIEFGEGGSAADSDGSTDAPDAGTGRAAIAPTTLDENVDMFAGEVRVFGSVDVTRVAIGNGSIVRAEILATGELLVIGQKPGSTSMRLWNKDATQTSYNIRVSETDPVTRVRMERMVRMRVRLVEFRKSALGQLGINWSDSTAGPSFAAAGDALGSNLFRPASEGFANLPNRVAPFSTYFGIASNITSRINFLASNGDAVTLAEPVLSAVNGGVASFLAGGEVPYPTVGANGQTTIDFKEYGIKLDVTPLIDDAGNVRAGVSTEISQLDPAVSVGGAPGLLTRRAQTQVNVRSGETIVISGLLSAESSNDIDRIPGLGRLPIIGQLFRSRNARESVTELVIFVTPEVIEPSVPALTDRERDTYERSTTDIERATARLDADRPSFME